MCCLQFVTVEWKVSLGFGNAVFFLRQQMNCRVPGDPNYQHKGPIL